MKSFKIFTPLTVSLLLVSCASAPNITLDRDKVGTISTASLLRVTESQAFMVKNLSGLSGLGGAIGGAIAGEGEVDRSIRFFDEYKAGSIQLSTSLVSELQRELSNGGLQVSYDENEFPKVKNGVDDYSHIQTDKDAILNVWFGPVGYIADGVIDAPYEPWLFVNVRMLDGKTKQILSQKSYTAGYKTMTKGAVFVPCAKSYRFNTFDDMMLDFTRSTEGLSTCIKAIAHQAAKDLQ